ncbi:hypothetical protein HK100_002104 [Physocladia obscura]|uniref:Uncharacterized protein n=1 Tax=Physocladia obscura TaxID=109957 RepID=A0AAD5T9S2_9FUNG|nr:hypothetical protein HK100_002104 [Physocladia obscura]
MSVETDQARLDALLGLQFEWDSESEQISENDDQHHKELEQHQPETHLFRLFDETVDTVMIDSATADSATPVDPRIYEVDSDEEELKRNRFASKGLIVDPNTLIEENTATRPSFRSRLISVSIPVVSPLATKKPHCRSRPSLAKRKRSLAKKKKSVETAKTLELNRSLAVSNPIKSTLIRLSNEHYDNPATALALHRIRFSFWLGHERCVKGENGVLVVNYHTRAPSSREAFGFGAFGRGGRGAGRGGRGVGRGGSYGGAGSRGRGFSGDFGGMRGRSNLATGGNFGGKVHGIQRKSSQGAFSSRGGNFSGRFNGRRRGGLSHRGK